MRKDWDLWGDLAAVGAATWMGLHVLRTFSGQLGFIVGAALTFNQTVGLLFGVWALGIVGAVLLHRLGALRIGWGFAAIYVLGYAFAAPLVNQVFAALGVIAWLCLLPAVAAALGSRGHAERIAPGILLGLAAQVALQAATHGLDLPLMRGAGAGLLAMLPATLLVAGLTAGSRCPTNGCDNTPGWGLLALAPYFLLQMALLANAPQVAIWTGWDLHWAAGLVLLGLAAGCAVLALRVGYFWRLALVALAVALLTWQRWVAGSGPWALVPAQACLALALPAMLRHHRARLLVVWAGEALLFFALYFAYHTKTGWFSIFPVIATLAALPAALPLTVRETVGAGKALAAVGAIAVLGVALGALPHGTGRPAPGPAPRALTLMTYNVHHGYDAYGIPSAGRIARVIAEADPDLIGLQEVARGLDIVGGADLAAWMTWRFPGYHVVYGPTEGDRQGNLLLSRYPVATEGFLRFPRLTAGEQRGLTWARVPTVGGDLTFVVTHFSAWKDEEADRMGQAEGILAFWRGQPRTAVAGDLNQRPDGPPIRRLVDGGLVDLAAAAGTGAEPTFPSRSPSRRIDYLFGSSDLQAARANSGQSTASDHLPVTVNVRMP